MRKGFKGSRGPASFLKALLFLKVLEPLNRIFSSVVWVPLEDCGCAHAKTNAHGYDAITGMATFHFMH